MGRLHVFASFILYLGIFTTKLKVESAQWLQGHATFYGESDGSGTEGGACGYGSLYTDGYGIRNAALSTVLFKNGQSCGGCYELVCNAAVDPQWCRKGTSITITATNYCPPNYDLPNDNGGWCNPPLPHFDMSQPAFERIAIYRGGIVPVHYRKVRCKNPGNIKFTINGRDGFELVLIHNVAGAGDISNMWIKGSKSNNWEAMTRNWGANWQSLTYYNGQSLSFRVRASDGQEVTAHDVAPSSWQFGQSFHTNVQFRI